MSDTFCGEVLIAHGPHPYGDLQWCPGTPAQPPAAPETAEAAAEAATNDFEYTLTRYALRQIKAEVRAEVLKEAANEMWKIFLRLPVTPSPLGDHIQRKVVEFRDRAAQVTREGRNEK